MQAARTGEKWREEVASTLLTAHLWTPQLIYKDGTEQPNVEVSFLPTDADIPLSECIRNIFFFSSKLKFGTEFGWW